MTQEQLVVYTTASIRKHIEASGVGIQVKYMQQGDNGELKAQDEVQISLGFNFPDRGSKNELYGVVNITALVKTRIIPTDIYYHTRIKARVGDLLGRDIPLLKVGGSDPTLYPKTQFGILRKCEAETIMAVGMDNPDASVIESYFEIQEC